MGVGNYYLLTALPPLGDLGSPPPLTPADLVKHVAGARAQPAVEAVLMGDDLLQREAFLAGEVPEVTPAVLTPAQARNEQPLPPFLAGSPEGAEGRRGPAVDALWEAYFRWADGVAERTGNRFLKAWVGLEVRLRNDLARARAKALGLEVEPYLVAEDLADPEADVAGLVAAWSEAPNPLEGLRVLDRGRWAWLAEHDAWFTFADDELAAYAAKLVLLVRWHRLAEESDQGR